RLKYYGRTVHGLREDVMEAVLTPMLRGGGDLTDALARMQALQRITTRPEFDPLIVGFKRAHRIIEKEQWTADKIDPGLFQHPTEGGLHSALEQATAQVREAMGQQAYGAALEGLVALKPAIDGFFVGVMV